MKIENKVVDAENNIIQVTTSDERWYEFENEDGSHRYVPSVTWICGYYPKDKYFLKWLTDNGAQQAEAIRDEAASRGSMVHSGCEALLNGETVKHDTKFKNQSGDWVEITADEYSAIISFANWFNELKQNHESVEIVSAENSVYDLEENFAGTVDIVLKVDGEYWIIDIKTSKAVYPSHKLQVSAYKKALKLDNSRVFILQVGYSMNKKRYKLNEIEDCYEIFKSVQAIWKFETDGQKPLQREYPLEVKIT